ncbi:DUF1573 domain-containing protein, partial [Proteiniphilum sp. X52]|uniref:DUF1573 domain-containing protein n=1 Tax=Proteiniphilum sp. X52 TaxID=2382159 RepID=UPI000F40B284
MRAPYFLLLMGVCGLMLSCKKNPQKEIAKLVTEWQSKEVVFPAGLVFTKHGRDTVEYELPCSSHKILVYVDSIGCTSCKLQLHKWKEFIEEVDSLTYGTVHVIFVFHPRDLREISYLLKRDGIDIPVCIDVEDKLNAMNRFPSHQEFQTFLLDDENKVVFIGNPAHNLRVKEMYLSEISGRGAYHAASAQSARNTQVETDNTEFDLGTIPKGEAKTVGVSIKNVGDSPFMIFDTRASCGCTHIEYEKRPVLPDSTTRISITYHADDRGYFNKTVSVYGNMDNSPLIIRL